MNCDLANAFSHPLRAAVVNKLASGPKSRKALASDLGEPLTRISYHLTSLRIAGLVRQVVRDGGQGEEEQPDYELVPPATFARLSDLDIPEVADEYVLAAHLHQALADGIAVLERKPVLAGGDLRFSSMRLRLDAQGRKTCLDMLDDMIDRLGELAAESEARVASGKEEGALTTIFLAGIPSEDADT